MKNNKTEKSKEQSEVSFEPLVMLRRIQELKMSNKEKELLKFCIDNFKSDDAAERINGFIDGKLEVLEQFLQLEIMVNRLAST